MKKSLHWQMSVTTSDKIANQAIPSLLRRREPTNYIKKRK